MNRDDLQPLIRAIKADKVTMVNDAHFTKSQENPYNVNASPPESEVRLDPLRSWTYIQSN